MADEDQAIAPSGQETATAPATTPADEPVRIPSPEEVAEQQQAQTQTEPDDDHIEIDWDDGKKYRIPKVLEGGILKNKDYTTKTQATAERNKALDLREKDIDTRLKATDDELDMRAELRGVNRQLDAYSKLSASDWAAHRRATPLEADDAWTEYQLLKEQKAALDKRLGDAAKTRADEAERGIANRVKETKEHAQKIPGFKPEQIDLVVNFLGENGWSEDEIKANWSPRFYDQSRLAMIGKALLDKQTAAAKSATPLPKVEPLDTVSGRTTPAARTNLADADMDQYVALRKQGVGGKAMRIN